MSERYKTTEDRIYFVSFSVVGWLDFECTKPNLKKPLLQLSAYWGSLQARSMAYQKLDDATKDLYGRISQNEGNYENYLKAKFRFEKRGTAANQAKMNAALGKVNQVLFNQTRNRAPDAKVE